MFSVVIPLYNKGSLIKRSIDSVLSQTFQEFEIVVVDDGSKDDSSEYVKEYKDPRVKYYYKQNGGVSSARNYGIEKAIYDWIVLLDADDELLPNALSTYKKLRIAYPKVNYLASRQDGCYSKKGLINKLFNKSSIHSTRFPYFQLWIRAFYSSPGTMCFHKKLVSEYGGFDTRMSFFEDLEFIYRIIHKEKVAFSSEFTMRYNQTAGGLSTSSHAKEKDYAYYLHEKISRYSFWEKALAFEIVEMTINIHSNNFDSICYYKSLKQAIFPKIYTHLHKLRQKLIRLGII